MAKGTNAEEMVQDIRSAETAVNGISLSEWEEDFVSDIEDRLASKKGLTEKQLEKLEEIWDRI